MAYFITLIGAVWIAAMAAWGPLMSVWSDREPVPLMRLEKRTLPFVTADNASVVQVGGRYEDDYYGAFKFTVHNGSVYPIRKIIVECTANWRDEGTKFDRMRLIRDEVILPGESRTFVEGEATDGNVGMDVVENIACEVVNADDPFSRWHGMPLQFSNLDWRQGYRERTRTR